jgi:hypothetical protein
MLAILERQIGLSRSDATFREKRVFVPPFGAARARAPTSTRC